jgi:hypothetical protein
MTAPGEGGHGVGRRTSWPSVDFAIVSAIFLFIYRFIMGRPILKFADYRPTNATFWHRATEQHSKWDRLTFWAFLPEGIRALIRLGSIGVIFAMFWWWWTGSLWAEAITLAGTIIPGVCLVNLVGDKFLYHGLRHRHRYVTPLHLSLEETLGVKFPERNIRVPVDFRMRTTGGVVLKLEPNKFYSEEVKNRITACVAQKLAYPRPRVTFDTSRRYPRMVFMPAIQPPKHVGFNDIKEAIENCKRGEIVFGLDEHERIFKGSFKDGEPHHGYSVNTQLGKSTHAQNLVAQILHQDVRNAVTYIDPKVTSCAPLIGTPGLTLANDPADIEGMWAAIQEVRYILSERRNARAKDPTAEFGLHIMVIDEINQFAAMTSQKWQELKASGEKNTAPIWGVIAEIVWQGAEFDIHCVFYGQRLDERACGGIGLRSQLGVIGLAGYRAQWWRTMVGSTPVPPPQRGKGRWIYVISNEENWVQNVFGSDGTKETWIEEIRDWAQAGRKAVVGEPTVVAEEHSEETEEVIPTVPLLSAVEISSDQGQGLVDKTFGAIRQAKYRARQNGDEWPDKMTLEDWQRCLKLEKVGS